AKRKLSPADMAQALRQQAGARAARPAVRIWLALGTVYILWGSTYLGIKYAIETIPPLMMGSLRFIAAGGVLYLLAIRTGDRRRDPIGARQWVAALLIGGALLVGGNGGVILAEQYAPTGVVALLVATAPLWMAIIDRVVFGRRLPELGRVHWQHVSTASFVALLYLIVFGSLVGFSAYVWLLRSAPLSLVSTYAYVNPVVAVILGAIFVGEAINARLVIAGGIIILAVALIVVARNRAASQARVAISA